MNAQLVPFITGIVLQVTGILSAQLVMEDTSGNNTQAQERNARFVHRFDRALAIPGMATLFVALMAGGLFKKPDTAAIVSAIALTLCLGAYVWVTKTGPMKYARLSKFGLSPLTAVLIALNVAAVLLITLKNP